jgi:hypothetical protein
MRSVIVDLVGDTAWRGAAQQHGASYIGLHANAWADTGTCEALIIDGRGSFDRGLELMSSLAFQATLRVFITERELPGEHQRAYLAGATRVVVMAMGEGFHMALLGELSKPRES